MLAFYVRNNNCILKYVMSMTLWHQIKYWIPYTYIRFNYFYLYYWGSDILWSTGLQRLPTTLNYVQNLWEWNWRCETLLCSVSILYMEVWNICLRRYYLILFYKHFNIFPHAQCMLHIIIIVIVIYFSYKHDIIKYHNKILFI